MDQKYKGATELSNFQFFKILKIKISDKLILKLRNYGQKASFVLVYFLIHWL